MLVYTKQLLSEGHSDDTIVHFLEMELVNIENAYLLIAKAVK
mgnify:CR=1 FL=1